MDHLIRNAWRVSDDGTHERASILERAVHPEGLDVDRLRFAAGGVLREEEGRARILSVLRGGLVLDDPDGPLRLGAGVHAYLPPDRAAPIAVEPGTALVRVASPRSRGRAPIVRDEAVLYACAAAGASLRWILTPQYLSRRIFLHHDEALLSGAGRPVSWFHTTMFDVAGLPPNADGESVFKMAYNSRTEINVCHDVAGEARVRMAIHPYADEGQAWGPWLPLDGESSYHLNEAEDAAVTEWVVDPATGQRRPRRNKHEVFIAGGHVTLFCLFDPAPTGVERHQPGAYSDYEPIEAVAARPEYEVHRRAIARLDAMVDRLSLARARGPVGPALEAELAIYREGHAAQVAVEEALHVALAAEGAGRDGVLARWMKPHAPIA